jgi:hypothetical protein
MACQHDAHQSELHLPCSSDDGTARCTWDSRCGPEPAARSGRLANMDRRGSLVRVSAPSWADEASSPHVAAKLDAQAPASGTPLLYTSLEGASVLVSTAAPLAIGSALLKLLSGAFPRRAPLNRASVTSINHPPTETRRRVHQSTTTSQTPSSPTSAPSNRVSGTAASLNAFFHRSPGLAPARPRC